MSTPNSNESRDSVLNDDSEGSGVLDRLKMASEAYHRELGLQDEAIEKAIDDVSMRHAPFVAESMSVHYQVLAEAYRAGYTNDDISHYLGQCEHAEGTPPSEN